MNRAGGPPDMRVKRVSPEEAPDLVREILPVIERRFPKEAGLVLGCRTSGRSEHAATLLEGAGYSNLIVQRAGFAGTRDALGRADPGWAQKGLPTSRQAETGRAWEELKADKP